MKNAGDFNIVVNGKNLVAKTIMNFELYGDYYCIYGVLNSKTEYDICCGKIVGNTVIPIDDEKENSLVNKIIMLLVNVFKDQKGG